MISITFSGASVSVYQKEKYGYAIQAKTNRLVSGQVHVQLSPIAPSFPRSFLCLTEDYSEITNLEAKIGLFGTLIIDGLSFANCYISEFKDIHEEILDSGRWTYSISFGLANSH